MSEDLRATNADAENRQPVKPDSVPVLMLVNVAAFNENGTIAQYRGFQPPPYGLDQEH